MLDSLGGDNTPLADKLWKLVGEQVDPEVTLGEAPSDVSSEIVERLRAHGLKETRYTLQGEVARGGMGAILEVWDEDLRRRLAMKVALGADDSGEQRADAATHELDPKMLGRFLEEAQVTGQLDHPGIVPVHELGVDDQGQVYFTMRLVKGRDLKDVYGEVHGGSEEWTVTRALGVLLKVCEAMAFAHAKGVIHRDLKPANIMVGRFGEVYVMDWGVARVLGKEDLHDVRLHTDTATMTMTQVGSERRDAASSDDTANIEKAILTMDGDVVGTPCYMSPEQARGELERMDARTDVYAMGSMLYHLLGGQMPFVPEGVKANPYAVLMRLLEEGPKPLQQIAPETPAELVAITEKAMARDPEQRYPDMQALGDDLRAYLERRVVRAYQTGAVAEFRKWVERNRALALTVLSAAVILLAGTTAASLVLAAKNDDLRSARKTAEASAAEARLERKNVLRLSAFKRLEDLEEWADELWPATPERLAEFEDWIAAADALIAGLHPSADGEDPGFYAQLATLRERALPRTPEEVEADRAAHPRSDDLARIGARLASERRAQDVREGGEPMPVHRLDLEALPEVAGQVNDLAWELVRPDRTVFGRETEGLALARLAVSLAEPADLAVTQDTLAWALFAVGDDAGALAASEDALRDATPQRRGEFRVRQENLRAEIAQAPTWLAQDEARVAELQEEIASTRLTYRFAEDEDAWWHQRLADLVQAIEAFDGDQGLRRGIDPVHGWGVERRLAFARSVEEATVSGAEARERWDEAIAALADPEGPYGGLSIEPQRGLLPLGPDPRTGLWEFAHLQSGTPAERGPGGRLVLREETGIVLVLVPGGSCFIGAQRETPDLPNYDPLAKREEGPVQAIRLSPFFLGKYELTQGQWISALGENPALYGPGREFGEKEIDLTHPVERVSWDLSRVVLERMELRLPTEAQWEYGARAGSQGAWSVPERPDLGRVANLADDFARRFQGPSTWDFAPWSDGFTVHGPVDALGANALGLHHTLGNVWEWCRDGFETTRPTFDGPDPWVPSRDANHRATRGGGFSSTPEEARLAVRSVALPSASSATIGLRVARTLVSSPVGSLGTDD